MTLYSKQQRPYTGLADSRRLQLTVLLTCMHLGFTCAHMGSS